MMARTGDNSWQPFDLNENNSRAERPDESPTNVLILRAQVMESFSFFEFTENAYRVGKTVRNKFQPESYWIDFKNWLRDEIEDVDGCLSSNPPDPLTAR